MQKTKKPKILVDGHVFDGKPQGTSTHISGLYSELARSGEVEVIVATQFEESVERYFPGCSDIRWAPIPACSKYRRLAIEFDKLAVHYAPDYMHFQYIAPLRKRARWIVTIHDLLFLDLPKYFPLTYRLQNAFLFGVSAHRADIVLSVSNYSREALARHFRIPVENISLTPNGIGSFAGLVPEPIGGLMPGNYFLYVSRFEPRKNQDGLIRALHELRSELPNDFQLVLVGSSAMVYPSLETELKKAGPLVRQMSGLTFSELAWLYKNARACLYPSFAEGFGIPPLEAVVAGGISYCAANTAMLEIADYVHGTFNANDDIQRVMRDALHADDTYLTADLKDRVLADFTWEHSAECLLQAIRQDIS